ncbi:murein transglycosylase [Taibaiella sp. KBW10]|uniref:lytic transglycosylase domain-containing protein n=1 Tax=Taibaiella sp. KBW10 TaxID=2153357 RepID=UPI000F597021|nr:lytic transglycosylase domain-containing protein [Taibaiella sp. KBW10]RQO30731.1 murein transglycosylase [Taibaiella sp. KBW10]
MNKYLWSLGLLSLIGTQEAAAKKNERPASVSAAEPTSPVKPETTVLLNNNKWFAPKLPKSIAFAGESTPLSRWDVKERLDRELLFNSYMHGSTIYILKLANRTFPIIERILKANGVPDDFKYLCVAESALYNQVSKAGAVGYWQFLKASGQQFGLEITDEVDERYDLERSTEAACRYLKQAYAKFGNWTAAAASYNMGMGGFSNYSSQQYESNYYNLLLPEETNRYVYRILALKHIIANADKLGFVLDNEDVYQPITGRNLQVSSSIGDLAAWAKQNGSTYQQIKIANQWLRGKSLSVRPGKTYSILIPNT